ncbi:MAG: hypothetical protein IPN98_08355 [Propionivibrio sp.]|nr:hypothetical protein [Propionivibrio sp.]
MADLATTIHETIEQHRYVSPTGELGYHLGAPACSCGWGLTEPHALHSRHVAKAVERVVLACLRDLTPEDRVVYGPWIREASHD